VIYINRSSQFTQQKEPARVDTTGGDAAPQPDPNSVVQAALGPANAGDGQDMDHDLHWLWEDFVWQHTLPGNSDHSDDLEDWDQVL
jgi:hypothetical protein